MPQTSSGASAASGWNGQFEQLDLGNRGPGRLEAVRAENGLGDGQGPLGAQPPGPQPVALRRAELAAARRGDPQCGLPGVFPVGLGEHSVEQDPGQLLVPPLRDADLDAGLGQQVELGRPADLPDPAERAEPGLQQARSD